MDGTISLPIGRYAATPVAVPLHRGFPGLDGLRGVAAIAVVAFHFRSAIKGYPGFPAGDGYLAVDLFFSLSGFVLAHAYLPRFADGMRLREFLTVRLIRLYPLYGLGLLVGSIAAVSVGFHPNTILTALATEIFLLPSLPPRGQLFLINTVAWSLFFEVVINIVFALVWRRLTTWYLIAVISISGVLLAAPALYHDSVALGDSWNSVPFGLPRVSFSFFFGVLLQRLHGQGQLEFRLKPSIFLLALAVLAVYLAIPVCAAIRSTYDLLFISVVVPLLVVAGINLEIRGRWSQACAFLGGTSYALYALHATVMSVVINAIRQRVPLHENLTIIIATCVYVATFLLISYGLDLWFDTPVRRFLTRRMTAGGRSRTRRA